MKAVSLMPRCRDLLERLRQAFPQPVSDPVHDAYFVFSILRALDQVDALKSQTPILGEAVDPDYRRAVVSRVEETGKSVEEVTRELVQYLEGMFIWGHPRSQVNVVPPPSIASIIGMLLPAVYNPNLCSDESGRRVSEAEVRATAMSADLLGYDAETAGGLFTFGGTGTLLYGVKVGLEKACPNCLKQGVPGNLVLLASKQSHYSCHNVAGWLGIGEENVISIPSRADNSIRVDALGAAAREALAAGKRIAAIVGTMGSTDAFGIDDLAAIVKLRDQLVEEFQLDYRPHIHADAVIGWAWSVFNDYDFEENPLDFRGRTVRALAKAHHEIRHLHLADSLGIDFHKTGYVPYVSSLVLFKDGQDLTRLRHRREAMPYLFQAGEHHPAMYSLETTRSGTGPMAALANLLLLGKQGLQVLLGHAVEMAEVLREMLESNPHTSVLNGRNVGPVTLFRVYPEGVDTFQVKDRELSEESYQEELRRHNAFNRAIFQRVHEDALRGEGVAISMTDCYRESDFGQPINALKSYVLSPFSDESRMRSIMDHVLKVRDEVIAEQRKS